MPRIDKRKIYIYNKDGELVKVCKNKESAASFAGTSTSSVIRSLKGLSKSSHCGYWFRYEEENKQDFKGSKAIVMKDLNNNVLKEYSSMSQAYKDTGINVSSISYLISGKLNKANFIKKYGFYFELYDESQNYTLKSENQENIIKPKKQEYYINVLVGLVNGTLIDGATYTINNRDYIYNLQEQKLISENDFTISRDMYITTVYVSLPLLTTEEKNFISQLKRNMSNIKSIQKQISFNGMEYIRLQGNNIDLVLDEFKEGTQYIGLKVNQVYELSELGI